MAEKQTYDVHRSMHGDGKDYERGDTRQMTAADAAELVKLGAVSLKGEDPAEREPAVEHTFGTKPSAVNDGGYTSANPETAITVPEAKSAKAGKAK